jgi:ADP-ribosyl-[dinitrogen reductase] hydrolase
MDEEFVCLTLQLQMKESRLDRFRGCLVGLAVGDALGTSVEFKPRGTFAPVRTMLGGGPFDLQPGEWTDDTSMALCLAASLLECGGFDARDQVARYLRWRDQGYMSSNGVCFDIGTTIDAALRRYEADGNALAGATHARSAGNGCLMRLAPVPMYYANDRQQAIEMAAESSRTTHGAAECLEACRLLCSLLLEALHGADKESILSVQRGLSLSEPRIAAIAEGGYLNKSAGEIRGSGYVVESLEAALWCFHHTDCFEEAVLKAVNLGEDADTTAAICGQLAGAHYGAEAIPFRWLVKLARRQMIEEMADALERGPVAEVN